MLYIWSLKLRSTNSSFQLKTWTSRIWFLAKTTIRTSFWPVCSSCQTASNWFWTRQSWTLASSVQRVSWTSTASRKLFLTNDSTMTSTTISRSSQPIFVYCLFQIRNPSCHAIAFWSWTQLLSDSMPSPTRISSLI